MRNWDVFREMEKLHRDIDSAFKGIGFGRLMNPVCESGPGLRHYPRINLCEDQDNLYVEALLPGIEPGKVELNVLGDTLTLSGERPPVDEVGDGKTCHRRERDAGQFMRTIELPVAIETDKVKAESSHGLLRVTLPKAAVAKPKKISVKVR